MLAMLEVSSNHLEFGVRIRGEELNNTDFSGAPSICSSVLNQTLIIKLYDSVLHWLTEVMYCFLPAVRPERPKDLLPFAYQLLF